MGATFEFLHIDKASEHFTGVNNTITKVTANRHNHPGGAYGYRVERAGKVLVFCTDIEHGDTMDQRVVALARAADLLVHEAQYTTEELKTKKGWGHSTAAGLGLLQDACCACLSPLQEHHMTGS